MSFLPSRQKLSERLIGTIFNYNYKKLIEKINTSNLEAVNFDESPYEVCVASNDTIIILYKKSIQLHDENFHVIKKTTSIDNNRINSYGIAINKRDEFYISDFVQHCTYMLDFNFIF